MITINKDGYPDVFFGNEEMPKEDEELYEDTLSQIINDDMFRLLGRHITVLDWLRELDFKGINYDGNAILRRNCHGRL